MALDPNTARLLDVFMNTVNNRLAQLESKIEDQLSKLDARPQANPAPAPPAPAPLSDEKADRLESRVIDAVAQSDKCEKRLLGLENRMRNTEIVVGKLHKTLEVLAEKKEEA